MKIVEEFSTLQGEGKYLGVPSYFIRSTGCNLRCAWKNKDESVTVCDTPYTSWQPEKGYELNVDKVLEELRGSKIEHIVLTGGEPTIQPDLREVSNRFNDNSYIVTVETNGTRYHEGMERAFISISPKLKSSYAQLDERERQFHVRNNDFIESTRSWMRSNNYQLKFVVNQHSDMSEIVELQEDLQVPGNKIYLMPQGISEEQFKERQHWLFRVCQQYGFTYTPRMHIDIFGNVRGS
ncbi:7-carboxy-7-deazaguanine synthase QueE [Candidatus Pacearchaeota archaeon]|nr:7-carboxy-7-deazaguanine synthase QueE [Candidatus Pacearchaeota archaeon]